MQNQFKNLTNLICLMILLFFCLASVLFLSNVILGEDHPDLVRAPFSKTFLKYVEDKKAGEIGMLYTASGHSLGLTPHPFDISYTNLITPDFKASLPANYNLRNENKLTPIRNQGQCGSCWAFATMGALESSFKPLQERDFSEQHLIRNHGFQGDPCEGGNFYQAIAYLARWAGPMDESDIPYTYTSYDARSEVQKHVQNVIFIPPRSGPKNNVLIKEAVMEYGAVSTSLFFDDSCYNPAHFAYYNKEIKEGPHAVAIVGWRDGFSKNRFLDIPPGNGAFIVRNSWGENWGEAGYFYVSYYDSYFASRDLSAVFRKAEPKVNYSDKYQYDFKGMTMPVGYPPSMVAWMANIFEARSDSNLKAVSFYAMGSTNRATIYVYTNVETGKPISGTLFLKKTIYFYSPGYYTVRFKQIPIKQYEKFSVVVRLNTGGWEYPIPTEMPIEDYTENVKAGRGQSFISYDGKHWSDIVKHFKNTNVCLKAFTK